jgi:hypothetical protein
MFHPQPHRFSCRACRFSTLVFFTSFYHRLDLYPHPKHSDGDLEKSERRSLVECWAFRVKMRTHSKAQFVAWCNDRGYFVDKDWNVYFKHFQGLSLTVRIPESDRAIPYLLELFFATLPKWNECHVFKRGNVWASEEVKLKGKIYREILSGMKISRQLAGSISFKRGEMAKLALLLFAQLLHSSSTEDDFFLIPETGRWMFFVSHHDYITVNFLDRSAKQTFEKGLKAEDFNFIEWTKKAPNKTLRRNSPR